MHFGPSLLQDQDPKLVLIGLAKKRFSNFVNRDEIINNDLFDLAINHHWHPINSGRIVALITEYGKYSFLTLCNSCEC